MSRSARRWPSCARRILDVLPEAEQGISYGSPAFKVRGKTIAGFAAFKNHLSYLPHSGSVFPQLKDELKGYPTSLGALRFDIDRPLPVPLVEKLIAVRLRQAFPDEAAPPHRTRPRRRPGPHSRLAGWRLGGAWPGLLGGATGASRAAGA